MIRELGYLSFSELVHSTLIVNYRAVLVLLDLKNVVSLSFQIRPSNLRGFFFP